MKVDLRDVLARSWKGALRGLDPAKSVREALPPEPTRRGRVVLVAAGKAAAAMAAGAFARWPKSIDDGLVVTVPPLPHERIVDPRGRARLHAASHPLPDARSVAAAEEALRMAEALGKDDTLLVLISGGASALMAAPPEGMTLAEKQAIVATLLERGLTIRDVNLVRRHLSRIKGGRLARAAAPAETITLIASDVIGGRAHDVGSGPSVPDKTTIDEARQVLEKAGIPIPAGLSESLKPEENLRTRAAVVLGPPSLGRALAHELTRRGLRAIVQDGDEGDVATIVDRRIALAGHLKPGEAAVIPCEPTITLPASRGRGGRAGWVALAAMRRLPDGVALLSAASDGVDGSSGAAGALVMREDAEKIEASAIDAALARFDDATVHRALGTHLPGGPTGQNLADVHVLARR
jgi:hydroxypyruvate reductase